MTRSADAIVASEQEEAEALETAEALAMEHQPLHLEGGLREKTARGTIINAVFRIGLSLLTLVRRLAVAAFLTPSELGVWGAVLVTVMTLMFLKNSSVGDKYIQQRESDQETAFQLAFTFEMIVTLGLVLLAAALLPVFALAYNNSAIVVPGLVLLVPVV